MEELFQPYDFNSPGKPTEVELVRDRYCIGCKHILACKGKPRGVKDCLCYEERKDGLNRTI